MRSNYRAKIRKASKNDLKVAILRSPDAMAEYYRLHCLTRQHHGLPPQPGIFFKKIYEHIIAQNLGFVTLVSQQGRYIAGAVFFCFGKRAVYKFGASELRYQHLYPNYLLFWEAIHWLCRHGYRELCFGRTDVGQEGLIHFKEGWGASNIPLNYYRYDPETCSFFQIASQSSIFMDLGINVCKKMPLTLLRCVGTLLYPHMD